MVGARSRRRAHGARHHHDLPASRAGAWPLHRLQDLCRGPIVLHTAGVQHQHLGHVLHQRIAVRDHDHRDLPIQGLQRLRKRQFAGAIEVGIGFVQHQQLRVAVQRPRQGDALALPRGQQHVPCSTTVS